MDINNDAITFISKYLYFIILLYLYFLDVFMSGITVRSFTIVGLVRF